MMKGFLKGVTILSLFSIEWFSPVFQRNRKSVCVSLSRFIFWTDKLSDKMIYSLYFTACIIQSVLCFTVCEEAGGLAARNDSGVIIIIHNLWNRYPDTVRKCNSRRTKKSRLREQRQNGLASERAQSDINRCFRIRMKNKIKGEVETGDFSLTLCFIHRYAEFHPQFLPLFLRQIPWHNRPAIVL